MLFSMSKDRFLKVFSNLPEDMRREIIVLVNQKPYTWNAAYVEVINNTRLAETIVKKLVEMEVI